MRSLIPTVNVGAAAQPNDAAASIDGGALLDFSTWADVYQRYFSQPQKPSRLALAAGSGEERSLISAAEATLPINHVWLRTQDGPSLLEQVRSALASPRYQLENLYDRRVMLASLQVEPLAVDLLVLLTVGAITTLLLALIGVLTFFPAKKIGSSASPGLSSCKTSQDSMPEQIKSSSAVGLAFDEFEPVDLPFHLSLTPFVSEGGQDGSLVTLDACGKGPQFWDPTVDSCLQPGLQRGGISLPNHLCKGLRQFAGCLHLRMGLLDEVEGALVFR
jgi:hypothetical protein